MVYLKFNFRLIEKNTHLTNNAPDRGEVVTLKLLRHIRYCRNLEQPNHQ